IHKVSLKPKGENMVVNVTYNNFLNTNNVFFPRLISMKTENTKAEYSFVVSIEKVTFDTPVDLSYTDRNKYTRITFGQLLNK
ncbi:MAG: DUF4292 domain-containing protein, partial [Prevotellaceae bacterium]|nr:DUF4292 domain-containing protein [Prevotellaceae bacterium]